METKEKIRYKAETLLDNKMTQRNKKGLLNYMHLMYKVLPLEIRTELTIFDMQQIMIDLHLREEQQNQNNI